ncbi:hypothetical protein JCM3765_004147 [Sporobolomyces pararoseus]
MPHDHEHHPSRRRRDSYHSKSSSVSSSGSDRRRLSEDSKWHNSKRHKDVSSGTDTDSDTASDSNGTSSSSGSSSDDSRWSRKRRRKEEAEEDHAQRRRKREQKGRERQFLIWVCGGVLVLLLLVGLRKALQNQGSTDGSPAASGTPTGSATKSSTTSSSSSKSNSAGGSTSSTRSSSSSSRASSSSTSTAPIPDASNAGPYKLVQDWKGDNFFDGWEFWDQADPTHGSVNYLSQDAAKAANLISTSSDSIIMKVDNTTKLDSGKFRDSVRIHSKVGAKIGSIIIADIIKMPFGCSTWPAWWTNGQNWPAGGEIDIIEGVNNQPENSITIHVSDSECKQDPDVDITGKPIPENDDCNANVKSNQGCSYREVADDSYGEPFNKAGGGVLVTSFTKDSIDVWFWSRPNIPENIQKESPDKSTWGKPTASWPTTSCNIEKYFGDHGDWAGAESVWSRDCGDKAPTCQEYLMDPSHFDDAYWEVAYVRVYEI